MPQMVYQFTVNYRLLRTHRNGVLQSIYKILKYSNARIRLSPRVW